MVLFGGGAQKGARMRRSTNNPADPRRYICVVRGELMMCSGKKI